MVVDPGIHMFGWTREQAVQFMAESGRFSPETSAEMVDRIAAMPGQLTAYDSGGLEIVALRREAEAALGDRFDLKQLTWASYGDYDRRQVERQCKEENVGYPFGVTHLNVKNLFALKHRLDREVTMDEALRLANMPLVGRHHSGKDDAHNIAALLQSLLM